jgi:hypothetical protein
LPETVFVRVDTTSPEYFRDSRKPATSKLGSRLFDHFRTGRATELVTAEGPRILIRPDGYIAHIGSTQFAEYAGEPVCRVVDRKA